MDPTVLPWPQVTTTSFQILNYTSFMAAIPSPHCVYDAVETATTLSILILILIQKVPSFYIFFRQSKAGTMPENTPRPLLFTSFWISHPQSTSVPVYTI
jgi:hypothetical protein